MRTIKNRNENGRPKLASTEVRKHRIEVRFSTVEYYALKSKAKATQLTISDFIRTSLRNSTIKERLTAAHLQLITKLTGMANNLNQIAKRANQAGYVAVKAESETLAKSIDNVIKSIENYCCPIKLLERRMKLGLIPFAGVSPFWLSLSCNTKKYNHG